MEHLRTRLGEIYLLLPETKLRISLPNFSLARSRVSFVNIGIGVDLEGSLFYLGQCNAVESTDNWREYWDYYLHS